MVCTLIDHRNDFKMFKAQVKQLAAKNIPLKNWNWNINGFWRPFPLKFLAKSRAQEREKQIAPPSRHFYDLCSYQTNQHGRNRSVILKFRFFFWNGELSRDLGKWLLFSWSWSVVKVGYNLGRMKKGRTGKSARQTSPRSDVWSRTKQLLPLTQAFSFVINSLC